MCTQAHSICVVNLTLVRQVVGGYSLYLVITMLWREPGWRLHGHATPHGFGSDVMQPVIGHVTPEGFSPCFGGDTI